jgi:hypothetical protein
MHRIAFATLLSLALAGCVAPPPNSAAGPPPSPGQVALSVIGTPFLIAFKLPVCLVAGAIAAPIAAASQLSGGYYQGTRINDELADGLAYDCGPPYVLTP